MEKLLFILIYLMAGQFASAYGEEKLGGTRINGEANEESQIEEEIETTQVVIPEYPEWNTVTINGKLKMKSLPLSPSLRLFMEKDSLIEISVRAPFMGEVGRIVVDRQRMLGINKMNKSFTEIPLHNFLNNYPEGIEDVQNLLLARVVIPGYGEMRSEIADYVDLYETEEGFAAVPAEGYGVVDFDYGYIVDDEFVPSVFLVFPESNPDVSIALHYIFTDDAYILSFEYNEGIGKMDFEIEFKSIEWGGVPMKDINIDKKYKSMSLGDFIRNFTR